MFGTMVHLSTDSAYEQIYQKVQAYLAQHFKRLPNIDVYYDAEGTIRAGRQNYQGITGGLVIVEIHARGYNDAIGLVLVNDSVELDAVSASARPQFRTLYGYHE